jgi:hypothetical protein
VLVPYLAVGGDYYINEQLVVEAGLLYLAPYISLFYYL